MRWLCGETKKNNNNVGELVFFLVCPRPPGGLHQNRLRVALLPCEQLPPTHTPPVANLEKWLFGSLPQFILGPVSVPEAETQLPALALRKEERIFFHGFHRDPS